MKVTKHVNYRIVVTPASAGDCGGLGYFSGIQRTEDEERKLCERVAEQIRRHVDDLTSVRWDVSRGVNVVCDTEETCSLCELSWETDDDGFPVCCNRAIEETKAS